MCGICTFGVINIWGFTIVNNFIYEEENGLASDGGMEGAVSFIFKYIFLPFIALVALIIVGFGSFHLYLRCR